jgi:hypothetical protein
MKYRSLAMSVAALSFAQVSVADAQSVYVAPGGVYVASGNVYVQPAPGPYEAPGVAAPSSYYGPSVYGAPVSVYAAQPPAVYGAPGPVYAAPPAAYGAPGPVYAAPPAGYGAPPAVYAPTGYIERDPGYVTRERVIAPTAAYAAEVAPRPPAPVGYYGRPRW